MNHELSVSVYSVITQSKSIDHEDRLRAYLYDHTTIVESHAGNSFVYTIVKTTVKIDVDPLFINRQVVDEVYYLANYQLGRLGSAPIGGILAGTLQDAQELLADAVVNS